MPRRELVNTPKQIRNRLRRKGQKFEAELELYGQVAYGKSVEEWDLEELARGRPRDRNGKFQGKTPTWITPIVIREAKRRLLDHTYGNMAQHVDLAVQTIVRLLKSKEVDDNGRPIVDARTQFAAAQFIIEHVIGKPRAVVEVEGSDTVRQYLAAALVLDDGSPAHPVIDGQFSEDDDEGEDDGDDSSGPESSHEVPDVPADPPVARRQPRRRKA